MQSSLSVETRISERWIECRLFLCLIRLRKWHDSPGNIDKMASVRQGNQMLKSKPPAATDQIDRGQFALLFDTNAHLEKIGKASVVVLASLFALGLLVTNVYLLQYGLSEFSLLRARFVLTGLLASFPTITNVSCMAFAYILTREIGWKLEGKSPRVVGAASFATMLTVGVVLPIVILGVLFREAHFTDSQVMDALLIWAIGFLPILPFLVIVVDRMIDLFRSHDADWFRIEDQPLERPTTSQHQLPRTFTVPLVVIGLLILGYAYVDLFVSHIYPNIPEQFGGGMPYEVQLLFRPDSVEAVEKMHISMVPGSTLSEPLIMLWHGDTGLLVRVTYEGEDDLILFDGSQVTAIILEND
jgi:hypothetical protein